MLTARDLDGLKYPVPQLDFGRTSIDRRPPARKELLGESEPAAIRRLHVELASLRNPARRPCTAVSFPGKRGARVQVLIDAVERVVRTHQPEEGAAGQYLRIRAALV